MIFEYFSGFSPRNDGFEFEFDIAFGSVLLL